MNWQMFFLFLGICAAASLFALGATWLVERGVHPAYIVGGLSLVGAIVLGVATK